jgi:Methyltransferase FkbM domain
MIRRTVRTTKVELRSGDEAICEGAIETPDVIKIDVEGHELQVLKGVSDTLHGDRVRAIFVEMHFALLAAEGCGEAPREIERLLKSRGFAIRWPDPSHLHAFREGETFFTRGHETRSIRQVWNSNLEVGVWNLSSPLFTKKRTTANFGESGRTRHKALRYGTVLRRWNGGNRVR